VQQRSIGSLNVSIVGVGCNNFGRRLDQAATTEVVSAALDAGITFFDTADIYGDTLSETYLGRALAGRRDEAVIATKFGMPIDDTHFGARPEYVRAACEDSLARLGVETIDLYQLHYPDESVPIDETLGALHELVAAGKVREIGCSNLTADQLRAARVAAGDGPAFVSIQNQYSLLARETEGDGVLEACRELGVSFLPFYPLANGLLTGKVRPGQAVPSDSRLAHMPAERSAHWLSDEMRERVNALVAFAEEVKIPLLTLAFSWLLAHAEVSSVIAGASNPTQVRANASAARELPSEVLARLDEMTS
jgi:aryl-alcohol dehydrogenase-like predicted oxidoreductase